MPNDSRDNPHSLKPDASTEFRDSPLQLPDRPNLRHLRDQARDLFKAGLATSLANAQFKIARQYGFASWTKLKSHVDSLEEIGQLKQAIDQNDVNRVKELMTRNPELHRAPLGYGKSGPLTWVAECRVPWGPPTPERLEIARWMIENGSDVHQGDDGPLGRAALNGQRVAMMELLVSYGANVNAEWNGWCPIIFSPCEAVDPVALKWLLDHGANPNCKNDRVRETALDYLIGSYSRSPQLENCIDILVDAGGLTKYQSPGVLELLRGNNDLLAEHIDSEPGLVSSRFIELDFGASGSRRLTLKGGTLLHIAAEYGKLEAAKLLVDRGADVNARAVIDDAGLGGQTPVFHSVSQFDDRGLTLTEFLIKSGADLTIRAKLPGHYET